MSASSPVPASQEATVSMAKLTRAQVEALCARVTELEKALQTALWVPPSAIALLRTAEAEVTRLRSYLSDHTVQANRGRAENVKHRLDTDQPLSEQDRRYLARWLRSALAAPPSPSEGMTSDLREAAEEAQINHRKRQLFIVDPDDILTILDALDYNIGVKEGLARRLQEERAAAKQALASPEEPK